VEGEKLVKDFGPSLSREQTDYIDASIAERKRRKQAQARIRYTVMAAICLLAIVAAFQWLRAERQRQSVAQAFKSEAQITTKLQEQLRRRAGQALTKPSVSSGLESGEKESLFLRVRSNCDPQNQVASERFFQETNRPS